MAPEYLLAVDAGSGSGRSVLLSTDGRECHVASTDWSYEYEPDAGPMACHFDAQRFWGILAGTIRQVLESAAARAEQVIAVSSTSQREGCVLLDKAGVELYAGPNRDDRAGVLGLDMARRFGDEIYARTGHFPSGMFAASRLQWFQRHQPELYERATTLLMLNDWVLYRLSGVVASEPTNASETCLFDIDRCRWADDLIDELGLRRGLLSEIAPAGTRIGEVSQAAGRFTGLLPGTPVVVGGADTQCGVLGSGAVGTGDMAVVAGTTAPLQLVLPSLVLDAHKRLWSAPYLLPGTFVLESNAGLAGTVYRWSRDTFSPGSAYEAVESQAASVPAGANGARAFVGVTVMNAAGAMQPPATLELGSLMWHGDAGPIVVRAILESLAFAARANADQISEVSPIELRSVTACGGLSRSTLYLNLLAACLARNVTVPRWREASGVGAAICAGVGVGLYKDLVEGQRQVVHGEAVLEPDPALTQTYGELFPGWLASYRRLTASAA